MSITSVFVNGGSQAVRIPKKYRFLTDRVTVQPMKGGILILPMSRKPTLEEFFAKCDELDDDERKFLSACSRGNRPQRKAVFG
jgi:virulence-associated protein VagC